MALAEYITVDDITHVHIKQFPTDYKQEYVDEANDWLEDLGLQKGVYPENIVTPVSIIITRYLTNYVVMRIAEDSVGSNNVEINDEDMYLRIARNMQSVTENLKTQITPELMRGIADANPISRSVSTGKLYRTA